MKSKKIPSFNNITFILCINCIILLFLSIYNIKHLVQPSVLNDEFGYWANAAYIFGYDWSGVSFLSPYYSYGYSLLLAPLFFIQDSIVRYQAAIVLNAVFYILSYLISYKCARKIFPISKSSFTALFCMIPALYSNNLLQANLAWTEATLYLCFWILFYLLLLIKTQPKLYYFLFLAIVSVYMYATHQRTLGAVIALFIVIILLIATRQITWKHFLFYILLWPAR